MVNGTQGPYFISFVSHVSKLCNHLVVILVYHMGTFDWVKLPVCYKARPDMEPKERRFEKRKDDGGA